MGKESYEERKNRRESKREAQLRRGIRKKQIKKIKTYAIVLVLVLLGGYGIYFAGQSAGPQGEDFSEAVPIMDDASHHNPGDLDDFEYNSNPPTSGPHYGQTARSGLREVEIPDGHIIHNLEHGDIWISFHPSVSDEVIDQLRQFGAAKVIITPRSANDTDIALAAWGRLDKFNLENDEVPVQRIEDFISRHMHKGPERIPGASGGI